MAVPLNDDLERARAAVAKAEEEVLLILTEKVDSLSKIDPLFMLSFHSCFPFATIYADEK